MAVIRWATAASGDGGELSGQTFGWPSISGTCGARRRFAAPGCAAVFADLPCAAVGWRWGASDCPGRGGSRVGGGRRPGADAA
jgi:hypothetical protein